MWVVYMMERVWHGRCSRFILLFEKLYIGLHVIVAVMKDIVKSGICIACVCAVKKKKKQTMGKSGISRFSSHSLSFMVN